MGNHPSFSAEGTHVAEILQSPRTEDKAKIAGDYIPGSVQMHLRCGGMCNNHIIANCPQNVSV